MAISIIVKAEEGVERGAWSVERGMWNILSRCENSDQRELLNARPMMLPLPEGEGRGEGEQGVRISETCGFCKRIPEFVAVCVISASRRAVARSQRLKIRRSDFQ
jgi:hypothetical protein